MNLRQFDLNLLVALDALLTERNVTRAGERLYLSQPAMSGILSRLRHAFNDELLVRVGRHLEPTAFAAQLAKPVRECVQQIEDLLSTQRMFSPETEARTFVIAASDYVVLLLLGPLVKRLDGARAEHRRALRRARVVGRGPAGDGGDRLLHRADGARSGLPVGAPVRGLVDLRRLVRASDGRGDA